MLTHFCGGGGAWGGLEVRMTVKTIEGVFAFLEEMIQNKLAKVAS